VICQSQVREREAGKSMRKALSVWGRVCTTAAHVHISLSFYFYEVRILVGEISKTMFFSVCTRDRTVIVIMIPTA